MVTFVLWTRADLKTVSVRRLLERLHQEKHLFPSRLIEVVWIIARRPRFGVIAATEAARARSLIEKEDEVITRAGLFAELGRAILPVSADDAAEYFRKGLEQLDAIGSGDQEFTAELLDFASAIRGCELRPRDFHTLTNICELNMYSEEEKFPWRSFGRAMSKAAGPKGLAKLSRWHDRDKVALAYTLLPYLTALVRDGKIAGEDAVALNGDVPEAVEVDVKRVATPRPCSVIGQGWIQQGGEPPMAKHDRRKTSGQPRSSQPVTIQVPLPVLGVINGVREAFHGLCIATGLQVLEAMMEVDRDALCGPKGRHQVERPAWRGGSVDSQVTLGGRQVEVPRLRVRSADGEVPLASFQWAASTDPLDEHTLAAVAAGVSTRRYASTLDPVPAEVNERATSSSAVSRRFVALSTKRLQAFLVRPLGELDLRVVCIDGKVFRDHCMVIALGIDTQGRKHVLGLREGATETAAVTTGLLSDLVTRGLPTDRALLFVVDGAAGLRRAITDVFGSRGVVQRCQVHKCRNVLGHLPERLHASVSKALRDAWNLDSADRAARVLERLAGSLERDHPGAAASIREGLEETLTVQRLGLTGALQRTLRTTNIIENLNGSVERYTRNVKRWRGGQMIQRWVASALVEAEPRFRRVRGYRDLQYLVSALDALAPPDDVVAEVA